MSVIQTKSQPSMIDCTQTLMHHCYKMHYVLDVSSGKIFLANGKNRSIARSGKCLQQQSMPTIILSKNVIVFPAAILQAPFYSLSQSASANYGGIGAVIAHEISHAFDNNGAKFDEFGNLNNWWTAEDLAHFGDIGSRNDQ